jgi:hypothetical protein
MESRLTVKKALFGVGTLALVFLLAFWGVFLRDVNRAGPFLGTTVGGYLPDPKIRYADWLQYEKSRRGASTLTLHGDGKDFGRTSTTLRWNTKMHDSLVGGKVF